MANSQPISKVYDGTVTTATRDHNLGGYGCDHNANQERGKMDGLNILMLICLIIVCIILLIINYTIEKGMKP